MPATLLLAMGCSDDDEVAGDATDTTTTIPRPEASTVDEVLALGRPIVLAHAGGEDAHPHSTPFGYAESARAGVDVLDFDVQLTADGVLVVQHDETVDRTTEGAGRVAEMTYDALHALDNAYWFTETCTCRDQPEDAYLHRGVRTGDRGAPDGYVADDFAVPRFEDLARQYPDHVLNVEIKGRFPDAVPAAEELARILVELDRQDAAVVTSFDDEVTEAFHRAAPDVEITPGLGATTAYVTAGTLPAGGRRILQVPPDYEGIEVLNPELVARTDADGLVLWIWPNEQRWENEAGYRELLDLGVEGINAADPAVAVETTRAWVDAA